MTIQSTEHVGVVVDDLAAATEFFVALGVEPQVPRSTAAWGSGPNQPLVSRTAAAGARPGTLYAPADGPNQVVSASGSPRSVRSPTQATCPSGRINTAVGAVTAPKTGSSHVPAY